MSVQSKLPEDWFSALEALLVRDRELDQAAKHRYALDQDPEKAPLSLHHQKILSNILFLFRKYQCEGYIRCLMGGQTLPYDPIPEIEIAGLRAVIEWLMPAPAFPPYTTTEEQHELRQLRGLLRRGAHDWLRHLENGDERQPKKRLVFNDEALTVTLDDRSIRVANPKAYQVYKFIAENGSPGPITKAEIAMKVPAVRGKKTISNLEAYLPEKLRKTILITTRGRSLRLPPEPIKKRRE